MRIFESIRWRLQFWYGLMLFCVLGGFGILAFQLERTRLIRRIDAELLERLPVLVDSQRPVPGDREMREFSPSPKNAALIERASTGGFYYAVWLRHSRTPEIFSPAAPSGIPMPSVGSPSIRQRGLLREASLFPGPGDCVLVGRSIEKDLAGLAQFGWVMAGGGAAVLLLGMVVGTLLIARSLRPVEQISTAARQIATGDLSQRIHGPQSGGELGELVQVLNSTFARLEDAFAQQTRFTADAAHELRTPVTVMLTHLQNALTGSCSNPEHREALEACLRAAQRMRRLIESLLQLARLDAGQEVLSREPSDLAEIVRDCVELTRPIARARALQIETSLMRACCLGDPDRLGQVVTNLLSNAVDYNLDGGRISISTGEEGGRAVLRVSNTGPLISPAEVPEIFERFRRADKARSAGSHSGLGLAIAKAIVHAHGGSIALVNGNDAMNTFVVEIPGSV